MWGRTESSAERVRFRKSRFDTNHQFEKTCLGSDYTEEQIAVSRGGQCGKGGKWERQDILERIRKAQETHIRRKRPRKPETLRRV